MLITFEVFRGGEHDWQLHLNAVTSILSQLTTENTLIQQDRRHDSQWDQMHEYLNFTDNKDRYGLQFLITAALWFDILSCVSTGKAPALPYRQWLNIPGLDTAAVMGCQNWVVTLIGDLAHLDQWKNNSIKVGLLSTRELVFKGQQIESALENGLAHLDLNEKGFTDREMNVFWVSRIFALAALLISLPANSQQSRVQSPGGNKGHPFSAFAGNISSIGYIEEEFFLSGDGIRYNVVGNLTSDGHWTLAYNSTAPYKTRMLVRRPVDHKKFNGDVLVEWINVSGGFGITSTDLPGVYEEGYIWASIDAQAIGIEGGASHPQGLIQWDPVRYDTLSILDDAISYDIVSQATNVLRSVNVTGGQIPKHVILVGASQSGSQVLGYTNGVQPLNNSYNAIIPAICAGASSDFSPVPAHRTPGQNGRTVFTRVRTDLKIPVFMINSETKSLHYAQNYLRQPNTHKFREWEVTGSSHANLGNLACSLLLTQSIAIFLSGSIIQPITPPTFPYIEVATDSNGVMDCVRNADGNTKGGIRLPELAVPVAGYNGINNGLSGNTYPFCDSKLQTLYPTHQEYVAKVKAAARVFLNQKAILEYQVKNYVRAAEAANVPPRSTSN
ncbi:hypothetical protein TrVGV298_006716 [Trichoderma virens]|nr:hypothetical protein TrVGV298_006716 [Trichoderma virens]